MGFGAANQAQQRWRDLSMDLVETSLRQRSFSQKITEERMHGSTHKILDSIVRYRQFMNLVKQGVSQVVPTLDIDICWHTHQLSPGLYKLWCIENIGHEVIHDDNVAPGDLEHSFRKTSLAWLALYNTGYTRCDLKKEYLSPGRIAAGIVFIPYGLHVILKVRKLLRTQIGMNSSIWLLN